MTGSLHSLAHGSKTKKRSKTRQLPGYLLHKASGQARVRIDGKDFYLGPYGSEASRVAYGNLIASHASGVPVDPFKSADGDYDPGLTVNELVLAFMLHAKTHYRKNGAPTSEIHCLKLAAAPLVELYGFSSVDAFGPLALKAVRTKMIELKWVRKLINKAIGRIRHIFRFGVENEMVHPITLQKLQAVSPLLAGRTEAKDNPPRTGVSSEHINAVRDDVSELVKDLTDLQLLTGARSGELTGLNPGMIDRSGPVWLAKIADHKTVHHGYVRTLAFGPQAQVILGKYLLASPNQALFKILRTAYCRAITRSCERLKIPRWVPHQLRHTAAGAIRSEFGLEHTQAVQGHASADMSEHYAKVSQSKPSEVALKIG